MLQGDLDVSLLFRITARARELQDATPTFREENFFDLLPGTESAEEQNRKRYQLRRHLAYLEKSGLIFVPPSTVRTNPKRYELTAKGLEFLQPELAEFGRTPMLP